jgi:hypothetical protein
MNLAEERRERNRRRWRRRRRRQAVVLLVLFPLLVGAELVSTNVVGVLDGVRGVALAEQARPRASRAGDAVKKLHLHEQVPVVLSVPSTDDLTSMPAVLVAEPLHRRFYLPGSHISPLVKRKLSKLRNVSRQEASAAFAEPQRSVLPKQRKVINAVFQPMYSGASSIDDVVQEFWETEQLYAEAEPRSTPVVLGASPVPAPGTGVLMSIGLVALGVCRHAQASL